MKLYKGMLLVIGIVILLGIAIFTSVRNHYNYESKYQSYWSLSEKSSTIQQKAKYMDKYVEALKNSNMDGQHNSVFYQTPDNSFDYNFEALLSLQQRLHEIETMDVTSFEYQTAIQQITAQEQGEAEHMISTFKGIWMKNRCLILWDWIGIIVYSVLSISLIISCIWWGIEAD